MVVLQEYFDWQVAKNPRQEAQLWKAFEKLGKEMYSLSDIRKFNIDEWGEMEIPRGLGQRLSHDIKCFKKERQEKKSSLEDLADVALGYV